MKLSFGMIFSIILIIIFVAFAIYTINIFFGISDNANSGKLFNDLQRDVDKVWKSSETLEEFEYSLPRGIDSVCFVDSALEFSNFVLYSGDPRSRVNSHTIKNLDIEKTTETENPICFKNSGGKIKITLKKDFSESLVTVVK